jgi:hypothetical protein
LHLIEQNFVRDDCGGNIVKQYVQAMSCSVLFARPSRFAAQAFEQHSRFAAVEPGLNGFVHSAQLRISAGCAAGPWHFCEQ